MSRTVQTKPLSAYKELQESDRRLVNKLIISLYKKKVDGDSWHLMNRTINRARRDPSDTGKQYTNGYLIFYKERFAQLKKAGNLKPVTEIAKKLGAEWKALTDDEKAVYNKQAAEQR
jgi:hypothetical protein